MFISDSHGPDAERAVAMLAPGDIAILENTRLEKGEEKNDPALADAVPRLGDFYVNDASSAAHRALTPPEGPAHQLPAFPPRSMNAVLEVPEKALGSLACPDPALVAGATRPPTSAAVVHPFENS